MKIETKGKSFYFGYLYIPYVTDDEMIKQCCHIHCTQFSQVGPIIVACFCEL